MPGLDHFGLIAPFYDRVIPPRDPARTAQIVGLPADGALLDAGGGTGRVTDGLRGLAAPLVVTDESLRMLGEAAAKGGLAAVGGRTERLPFADQTFARILMVDALHHVADQRRTLAELWRVLRRDGRLVIEEPDIRLVSVKLVALGEKLVGMRSHFLTAEAVAGMLAQTAGSAARIDIQREGFNYWVIAEK